MTAFLDGDRSAPADGPRVTPGTEACRCHADCQFPCWERIGTFDACLVCGCPPFPEDDGDEANA